jgi:hypothetical protein
MDESEKDANVEPDKRSAEEDEQSEDAFGDIFKDSDKRRKMFLMQRTISSESSFGSLQRFPPFMLVIFRMDCSKDKASSCSSSLPSFSTEHDSCIC